MKDFADHRTLIEFSVSYTYPEYHTDVAKEIHVLMPNVKLFVVVRHPIERAFSDYLRSIRLLEIPRKLAFEDAVQKYPVFLERGSYGRLLQPFYDLFPPKNLLVLFYDDLKSNPRGYLKNLLTFLGVDPDIQPYDIGRTEPVGKLMSSSLYNRFIFGLKNLADTAFERVGWEHYWKSVKAKYVGFYGQLLALNEKSARITSETRQNLRIYYEQDLRLLEQLTGRDLSHWN